MDESTVNAVLDTLPDVFYVFDADGTLVEWNDRLAEVTGYDDDELDGMAPLDFIPEEDEQEIATAIDAVLLGDTTETRQSAVVTKDGEHVPYEFNATRVTDEDGTVTGFTGTGRNLSKRRKRERTLRRERDRTRQLLETSPIGILILDGDGQLIEANERAETILGLPKSEILDRTYDDDRWNAIDETGAPMPPAELPFAKTIHNEEPVYDTVMGVERPDGERVWLSVKSAPVFDDEGTPVEVVASISNITDRRRRERELRQQRDEVETLNRINELVREVIHELVGAATREEIEETVCTRLADSDLYRFAWVGDHDLVEDSLVPQALAGDDQSFHELVGEVERENEVWERPATKALRTGRHVVVRDFSKTTVLTDRLREGGLERGLRSGIAVPLSYGQTTYGVLVVYATRTDAFSEREAAGFDTLGELVGFAINATENKKLLATDQAAVELMFRVTDDEALLVNVSRQIDGTLVLDGTVPTSDGRYLYYVRVEDAQPKRVADTAETVSTVNDSRVVWIHDDEGLLVLTVSSSLVESFIESSAKVRTARAHDGVEEVVVEVTRETDIRTLLTSIQSTYPDIELVAKRDVERTERSERRSRDVLSTDLTDRQRSAFHAAYLAGYYDWPRESTAEQVAESMGIAPATLHQHLRKAEGKLASSFFDSIME